MKHNNRNLILILILIIIVVFTGCSSIKFDVIKDKDEPNNNVEANDDMDNIDSTDDEEVEDITDPIEDTSDNDEPTPALVQPIENTELMIYIVNSLADLDPVIALVPAENEITPELVVDTVVESMADQSLVIGIEKVSTEDDIVIVSFYSDQPPLQNVGSGLESAILNAIAQSLLDNLDDYHKVIYRVEGGPYESGHIALGLDEIYSEDVR